MKTIRETITANPIKGVKLDEFTMQGIERICREYAKAECIDFLESIKDYERESRNMVGFDERESSEIYDIYVKTQIK